MMKSALERAIMQIVWTGVAIGVGGTLAGVCIYFMAQHFLRR